MKKEVENEMEDDLCPEYDLVQMKGGLEVNMLNDIVQKPT